MMQSIGICFVLVWLQDFYLVKVNTINDYKSDFQSYLFDLGFGHFDHLALDNLTNLHSTTDA